MPIIERGQKKTGLFQILYSPSGYGKTTLAAGYMSVVAKATGREALYCDWDGGIGDVDRSVGLVGWAPSPNAEPVMEAQESIQIAISKKVSAYVVDTTTMLARSILQTCPPKGKSEYPHDYSLAQSKFHQWAMQMFDLNRMGIDVLWVLHEGVEEVKEAKGAVQDTVGGPETHLGKKFLKTIPALSRQVYRIKVVPLSDGRVSRVLQTDTDGLYIAKDRLHAFPPGGVKIGVSPYIQEKRMVPENGKQVEKLFDTTIPKPPDLFEADCLAMSEKVWRTVFKASERREGQAIGVGEKATATEAIEIK